MDSSVVEDLLWEIVSQKVEQVSVAKTLLGNVGYIDKNRIDEISACTIIDSDYFEIVGFTYQYNKIELAFEMPFILDVWNVEEQRLFSITAFASGKCLIPGEKEFDYAAYDFSTMKKDELLSCGKIVDVLELSYSDVEVSG